MTINTSLPIGTLKNILTENSSRPLEQANKVINFFRGLAGGARVATVLSGAVDSGSQDAVAASQTASFSGAAAPGDTVTIAGVIVTAVVSSPTNNQWIAGVSASADAAALASAINSSTTDALSGNVNASASGSVCTISCNIPGVIGNQISIQKASAAITLGGSALLNGLGKLPPLTTFHFSRS